MRLGGKLGYSHGEYAQSAPPQEAGGRRLNSKRGVRWLLWALLLLANMAQAQTGMFSVGAYRLYLHCEGRGSSTVVLLSGLGQTADAYWSALQDDLGRNTRVCIYDRAGVGKSERGPVPATAQQMAGDLNRLLEAAKIQGPVLLVGQGFSALTAQLFASQFRSIVAGVVLIEPHTDQAVPTAPPGKGFVGQSLRPAGQIAGVDYAQSLAQVRGVSLGTVPLRIVLPGTTGERQAQIALQGLSSRSQVISLSGVQGDAVEEAPALIANVIRGLLGTR